MKGAFKMKVSDIKNESWVKAISTVLVKGSVS